MPGLRLVIGVDGDPREWVQVANALLDCIAGGAVVPPGSLAAWALPTSYAVVAVAGLGWGLVLKVRRPQVYATIGLAALTGPWIDRFRTFDQTLEVRHPTGFAHHHLATLAVGLMAALQDHPADLDPGETSGVNR